MGKVDRCAQLKKEAAGTRRRVVAETKVAAKVQHQTEKEYHKAEEARLAEERFKATTAGATKFERALKEGRSKSTFSNAATLNHKVKVYEEEDNDGEDYEDEDYDVQVQEVPLRKGDAQPKKESNASRKRQQAERNHDEMQLLAREEQAARRQRIVMRLLRLLVVGFVIDSYRDRDAKPAAKEGKTKKKGSKSSSSETSSFSISQLWEKVNVFGGPFLMLLFTCALFGARIAGEDFTPDATNHEVNLYEVLGVSSDAGVLDIRKAYKALALSWHPDKNPGCEACSTRFGKISQAYETLNSPERRKAYDQRRAPEGSLESVASVDLTADDFEARVSRSNDVWYVQVYDPQDGLCNHFHPVWEDVAQKHADLARFGRLDIAKHRRAVSLLPQRVGLVPLVFRFARGLEPVLFQWNWNHEERGSQPLVRFVQDNFPEMHRVSDGRELKSWWESGRADRPRILVTGGPASGPLRGASAVEFMQVQRVSHMWEEFFDSAVSDARLVSETLGGKLKEGLKKAPGSWAVAVTTAAGAGADEEVKVVEQLRDVQGVMQEMASRYVSLQAPHVTVRNYQQLCGAPGMRRFCLVLVDVADGPRVNSALEELGSSRASFTQEVAELRSADEEATEEPFHIQPVRVMTSSSRLPWHPVAAGSAFSQLLAAADKAPAFVVELETRRIAAIRTSSFRELYQQIAYDDLKFTELPEGLSLARGLPDPETPLRRELLHLLSTLPGSLLAFLLAAAAIAIVPELSLAAAGASVAAAVTLLIVAWPIASRRCVALVWCTVSPSSFECLVGS